MSSVVLWAETEAPLAARRELIQALLDWTVTARRDPDVLMAKAYEDLELHATFSLVAEWKNDAALEVHLRSRAFGVLLGALEVLSKSFRFVVTRATGDDGADALPRIRRGREAGAQDRGGPRAPHD